MSMRESIVSAILLCRPRARKRASVNMLGPDERDSVMNEETRSTEWLAWLGLAVASFAVLEHRAIKSARVHPTLSRFVASRTRKSKTHQFTSTLMIVGSASWLAYHFNYEAISEDGTFASYAALDKALKYRVA